MLFAHLNYLYSSILFYFISKIVCSVVNFRRIMHTKRSTPLSSIPEKSEIEEDNKWVPKKKHEVLKAKYKCLKKLFQIYDASVIGMLPEPYASGDMVEDSDESAKKSRKRKRSHRVKMDACAGTSDHEILAAVQVACSKTNTSESESCTKVPLTKVYAATQASRESLLPSDHECGCALTNLPVMQFQSAPICTRARMCRQRKRTRFQSFMQRLLGIRSPNPHRGCALAPVAVSECDIHHNSVERRRRRRLRFRRTRRPTRAQSEGAMRAPAQCAQAVQRNCLLDTTPRQCPIAGCRMMLYGIINYNDHLNLCHFTSRRFVCHFCHEGFEREADKLQHEDEHIGLPHLTPRPASPLPPSRSGITSVTQTDPEPAKEQDEKLKKIVSFFDKIVDSTQMLTDIKKSRHSDMNLRMSKMPTDTQTEASTTASDRQSKPTSSCSDVTGKRLTYSCNDLRRGPNYHSLPSDGMSQCCSANCNFCGENFDYGQALERKFGEFRSCGALPHRRSRSPRTEDGRITVNSGGSSVLELDGCASSVTQSSLGNGVISLTDNFEDSKPNHKPSTSVVFNASEYSRRVSTRSLADRVKSYRWEPCTRIIRV